MPHNYVAYLVMALALVFVIRRTLRSRTIRAETLWVIPALLVAIAAVTIAQSPPRDLAGIAVLVLATLAGAGVGWQRGRLTRITLDAETGALTGQGSIWGLLLILLLLAARYGVITWAHTHPDHGGWAVVAADAALLFGYATLIVARLEMFVRCRKLMTDRTAAA
jgi:hypothetical protein